MYESTVTAKGQTTLPKDVRELLGVEAGDRIRYLVTGDSVRILRPRKAMSLCGALKPRAPLSALKRWMPRFGTVRQKYKISDRRRHQHPRPVSRSGRPETGGSGALADRAMQRARTGLHRTRGLDRNGLGSRERLRPPAGATGRGRSTWLAHPASWRVDYVIV